VVQQNDKAKAKNPGKGGRLKVGAPERRLRTLSEQELLKVRGGQADETPPKQPERRY
jgi:hypothetical protein